MIRKPYYNVDSQILITTPKRKVSYYDPEQRIPPRYRRPLAARLASRAREDLRGRARGGIHRPEPRPRAPLPLADHRRAATIRACGAQPAEQAVYQRLTERSREEGLSGAHPRSYGRTRSNRAPHGARMGSHAGAKRHELRHRERVGTGNRRGALRRVPRHTVRVGGLRLARRGGRIARAESLGTWAAEPSLRRASEDHCRQTSENTSSTGSLLLTDIEVETSARKHPLKQRS